LIFEFATEGSLVGSFNKLKKLLEEKESFLLICHSDPDGDAVGSVLALSEVLRSRGKKVASICKDNIPAIFNYLDGVVSIKNEIKDDFDAVILLDNGDFKRTGFVEDIKALQKQGLPVLNIDHHPKNDLWKVVNINYCDEKASSTAELIYKIFIGIGYEINPSVATSLLTGIFYDTGGFRHPNTTETVLSIAAELLKKGAKLKKISENIANVKSMSVLKIWGIALNRLKYNKKLGISFSVISQKDLDSCGATEEDVSGLVNLLNSSPESKAALLLCETKDGKIKGSLRTDRDDVDVAKIAELLGGGGHRKASGFTIDGKLRRDGEEWRII
jgi:bifunctional oligoribonuclease and PAP phosphatase NrnA